MTVSTWQKLRTLPTLGHLWLTRPQVATTLMRVRRERLTYLTLPVLLELQHAAAQVEKADVPGIFIEAGCALGGSAIVLAATKNPQRPMRVYDVFGMIPPPSANDGPDALLRYQCIATGQSAGIGGDLYYGYQSDLLHRVTTNFARHGVPIEQRRIQLIQGLYEDTLHIDEPVALAHIDCDWHDSVWTCLTRIGPYVSPGGKLIIDDYQDLSGCRKAVDRYFEDKRDDFVFELRSRLHITRRR